MREVNYVISHIFVTMQIWIYTWLIQFEIAKSLKNKCKCYIDEKQSNAVELVHTSKNNL